MLRTDLAMELMNNVKTENISDKIKRTDVKVDKILSQKLNKPVGTYITIESCIVKDGLKTMQKDLSFELSKALSTLVNCDDCLVVGLGNPNMTADALGKHVTDKLMVTRHLDYKELPLISCICPNVYGVTGIESFDIVKGVVDRIKPGCVIVIDSLAGASTTRIASAFQISDAGITPGSGVSNHRIRLDKKTLNTKVISIGVPLVVYATTIINDAVKSEKANFDSSISSLIVTPKDIDIYVLECADIVASAINQTFFGTDFNSVY